MDLKGKKLIAFNRCSNCKWMECDSDEGYAPAIWCNKTSMGNLKTFPFMKAMKCFEVDFYVRPQYREPFEFWKTKRLHLFIRFVLNEKHWGWSWHDHVESHCERCCWEKFSKKGQCGSCNKFSRVQSFKGICFECDSEDEQRVAI